MASVLVTGGAGFIGSTAADAFLADGWAVTIVDDFSTGRRENIPATATLVEADIASARTAQLIADSRFDVLVHCAAQMNIRRSVADPLHDATTNILGTVNIAEAVRSASPRTRIVFSSTGGALYGGHTTPPNQETFAKDPESPYAVSKLAAELYLTYYGRVHGVDAVSLRLGNVYGPRQDPHGEAGVVAIFCERVLQGQSLTVFGDGEQTRDYVYVDDVVRAVQLAAVTPLPPPELLDSRAFNIGSGVPLTVNELAIMLQKVAGQQVAVEHASPRAGELQHSWLEPSKAHAAFGWKAEVSLEDGLRRTLAWLAEGGPSQPRR
jgi:UDP-glucose 4-epimerase